MLGFLDDCFVPDLDYYGNGIKLGELKTISAQECQSSCVNNTECVEFTWIGPLYWNSKYRNRCYLKNDIHEYATTAIGYISGPKYCGKCWQRKQRFLSGRIYFITSSMPSNPL